VLALLPVGFVVQRAVALGWSDVVGVLLRPRIGTLLINTVVLVTVGTLVCVVLGTGAAWLVERTDLPGRRVWAVLLSIPIAVPAFVRGYGWISVLPEADEFVGALLVVCLSYYPLVFFPVCAALRSADRSIEEAARGLGLGPHRTFLRVSLPNLRPALLGGALLVALDLLAEFGAFALLRFPTLTTAVYEQYRVGFNSEAAALLSLVLVSLCVLLLAAELALRGRRRYVRVGPGTIRPVKRQRLSWATVPALMAVLALVAASLGLPIGVIGYWLTRGSSEFDADTLISAAVTTFGLGLAATVAGLGLALPTALLAVRHRCGATTLLERVTYLAHVLPAIVVALAFVTISNRLFPALYQSATLLVAAYVVLFLPRVLVSVRSALEKAPPAMEEAARALGRRPFAAFSRVTIPLIAPGLSAGAALVFLSVTTELTSTLLLAPIGTETLATQVWTHINTLDFAAAAPPAALMMVVSIPVTLLLTRRLGALGWGESR
jgi:iron(III) transport system permease protein